LRQQGLQLFYAPIFPCSPSPKQALFTQQIRRTKVGKKVTAPDDAESLPSDDNQFKPQNTLQKTKIVKLKNN
jgi:hypothetical protein